MNPLPRRTLLGAAAAGLLLPGAARAQTAPRKGGTLRFCRPDGPDMLDPMATNSYSAMEFSLMVYDNLVQLDADGQPVPQLALSWTPENGGLEWVITLREGVVFHDGSPFTSADVVATVERSLDKAASGFGYQAFGPVKEIKSEGDHKVRFVLNSPFGEFPVNLAYRSSRILCRKGLDTLRDKPNGTGPFVFKEFQPGSSLTVTRNDRYWDPTATHLDGVRMVFIREAVAMQAALRGGQVDMLTQIPVETYLVMRNVAGFKAYSTGAGDYQTVQIMANMKPFDNPKVREAFQYIPDRKAIVASALFGQGQIGNDLDIAPGDIYLPKLPQFEQDLPRAKKLLEESGVGPIDIEFYTTSDRQPAPKMALAIAEAAGKIGVKLTVRDVPYTEYAANVARKKPMYNSNFGAGATLFESLYRVHHSKAPYNYSGVEVAPGLDAKLDALVAEVDLAKRKTMAAEILTTIHAKTDRLVPYFRNYLGITSNKVQGFVPPKFQIIDMRGIWLSA